jgi:phytoene/squalene synthetase
MITPVEARSGKGHRDENFPVASRLIHPRHRAPILAFYEFVRTADDIADHATLAPQDKLALPVSSPRATHRTCSPRSAWT